jgi:cytochrome c oxidase subunit 1
MGLGGVRGRPDRRRGSGADDPGRPRLGALHLYPPLTASPFFYIGLVLVVAGSWVWCAIMIAAMAQWKEANPGQPVPLAMFATVANAIMWLWTTAGVAVELLFQVIPAAFD